MGQKTETKILLTVFLKMNSIIIQTNFNHQTLPSKN